MNNGNFNSHRDQQQKQPPLLGLRPPPQAGPMPGSIGQPDSFQPNYGQFQQQSTQFQPMMDDRDMHVPTNFYRTEIDQEPHYLKQMQAQGLTDQQIIDKAKEDKNKIEQMKELQNLSKEQAVKLLKDMLRDVGVGSTWKWDDALRNIKSDERYRFIKMPMQERKAIFNNFMIEIREEERQYALLKKKRQRALFMGLLEECRESGYIKLDSSSKYYLCSKKLAQRDYKKFIAVDERDRDEFFQDYIDDLFKQERDEKSIASLEQIQLIKSFLQEKFSEGEESPINFSTRWKEVNQIFENEFTWNKAEQLERLIAFEEFIKDKDNLNYQTRKNERLRVERKRRENFENMVKELLEVNGSNARKITHVTSWEQFVQQYKDDERYLDLLGQSYPYVHQSQQFKSSKLIFYGGSQPHEIYEDLMNQERDNLKKLKPLLKSLIKGNGVKFTDTSFQIFDETLKGYDEYCKLSNKEKVLLHEYYLDKLKQKEQEKNEEADRLKDEIQYQMKKKIDLKTSSNASDYLGTFDKILTSEKSSITYNEQEKTLIIQEVIDYLEKKDAKKRVQKQVPERKRSRSKSRSKRSPQSSRSKDKKHNKDEQRERKGHH